MFGLHNSKKLMHIVEDQVKNHGNQRKYLIRVRRVATVNRITRATRIRRVTRVLRAQEASAIGKFVQ